MKQKIKSLSNTNMLFLSIGVFFAGIMSRVNLFGDDVVTNVKVGMNIHGTLIDYFEHCKLYWSEWSSRIIVNYFILVFNDGRKLAWAICMGLAMALLLWSIYQLCEKQANAMPFALLSCALVLSFSYSEIMTAGWIATSVTYFIPVALGVYALLPIKKRYAGISMRRWEYITYSLSILIAANNEQVAVVLLLSYAVTTVYFLWKKQNHKFFWWTTLLCVASFLLHLLAPGNEVRMDVEMRQRFQTFSMMTTLDKAELGLTTAVRWLLFDKNIYVLIICGLLMIMIFEKYKSVFYRVLSVIPFALAVTYTFFYNSVSTIYTWMHNLGQQISRYGMINPENAWNSATFVQFFIFAGVVCIIMIELFLLQDTLESLLVTFTLLFAGVASRVAVGFSPSIFESGNRTCVVMSFSLILMVLYVASNHIKAIKATTGKTSILQQERAQVIYILLILLGALDLIYLVIWDSL